MQARLGEDAGGGGTTTGADGRGPKLAVMGTTWGCKVWWYAVWLQAGGAGALGCVNCMPAGAKERCRAA